MTDEQLASLNAIGASLQHIGSAIRESHDHARYQGSKTPLQPLDQCLAAEIPNLQREGQAQLVGALAALRIEFGD